MKELIFRLNRLDALHLINLKMLKFVKGINLCDNFVLNEVRQCNMFVKEVINVQDVYDINVHWSIGKISAMTYMSLKTIVMSKLA